ncbi:MAG: FAD-binding protein [Candidatus Verstraetearchaeota archaeon]|nr:FAD-binding protein [Candidatus Verstraetearchaeota archaeon]
MAETYDVIIVGGGPAGITAAIYTRRKLLKTLLISKDIGGQILLTGYLENYPGFVERSGIALADVFERQIKELGTEILVGEVKRVKRVGDRFKVISSEGEFLARVLIVTGGSSYKKLNVPGEEEFFGRGVSTCATCDAPLARNRVVAVVGGGNAALQGVELLAKYASKVYAIHRRERFRADEILVERVRGMPNVEPVLNSEVKEVRGEKKVEGVLIKDVKTGEVKELMAERVFIEVGREIKLDYIKHLVRINKIGQVIVDREQRTSCRGIFAAGDITDLKYGQAIIAAGDGAVAALSAYDYLMEKGR